MLDGSIVLVRALSSALVFSNGTEGFLPAAPRCTATAVEKYWASRCATSA